MLAILPNEIERPIKDVSVCILLDNLRANV